MLLFALQKGASYSIRKGGLPRPGGGGGQCIKGASEVAELLRVENLHVTVAGVEILRGVDLTIGENETHVLMGPNGSGKSTLGYSIMGHPKYIVTEGRILFRGEDITKMSADKRAALGLFLSFQAPLEVPGLTMSAFLRKAMEERAGKHIRFSEYRQELKKQMEGLQMDASYASRALNVGFSGGEKKKSEILQLNMLKPQLAILDEADSGLDVDAVKTVAEGVARYQKETGGSLFMITHSTRILENLKTDRVHVLVNGRIVDNGGPELADRINAEGFAAYEELRKDAAAQGEAE